MPLPRNILIVFADNFRLINKKSFSAIRTYFLFFKNWS